MCICRMLTMKKGTLAQNLTTTLMMTTLVSHPYLINLFSYMFLPHHHHGRYCQYHQHHHHHHHHHCHPKHPHHQHNWIQLLNIDLNAQAEFNCSQLPFSLKPQQTLISKGGSFSFLHQNTLHGKHRNVIKFFYIWGSNQSTVGTLYFFLLKHYVLQISLSMALLESVIKDAV